MQAVTPKARMRTGGGVNRAAAAGRIGAGRFTLSGSGAAAPLRRCCPNTLRARSPPGIISGGVSKPVGSVCGVLAGSRVGRRGARRRAVSVSASASASGQSLFDTMEGADSELLDRIRDNPSVTIGPEQPDGKMSIVFASSEVAPWSKTGGLGDVCGSLPRALANRGHRVMVVSPLYQGVGPFSSSGVSVEIDGTSHIV